MTLKDLKLEHPKLYLLACQVMKNQGKSIRDNELLSTAFVWKHSRQGKAFWSLFSTSLSEGYKHYPLAKVPTGTDYKKGDYVVLLHGCSEHIKDTWKNSMPIGYCFKLRSNSSSRLFQVEKDINDIQNGWDAYNYSHSKLLFRAATWQEIQEYKKLGKPFNVVEMDYNNIDLKTELNVNKKENNEKSRLFKKGSKSGRAISGFSSRKRQIATSGRLIGNKKSVKRSKPKIITSKISRTVITI